LVNSCRTLYSTAIKLPTLFNLNRTCDSEYHLVTNVCLAMLPMLEHAEEMSSALQKLESENQLFKAALEQHEAEARKRGEGILF
jgi:hypothetical protein